MYVYRFAGQTLASQTIVLVTIHLSKKKKEDKEETKTIVMEDNPVDARIVVNCDKIVIGSMLLQELKEALK